MDENLQLNSRSTAALVPTRAMPRETASPSQAASDGHLIDLWVHIVAGGRGCEEEAC
jgi:hypothetical protein